MIKYSIIIGTYNHLEDCLKPCCEALMKYTDMSDKEIIIVANGCTDGTREYVESLPAPFRLLWFDEPLGFPVANNYGILASSGEYVILLNNDALLLNQERDEWIRMLEKPFADPKVGLTCPIILWVPGIGYNIAIFFCVMIRRDMFARFGIINTEYKVGYGEDAEFCVKMCLGGYTMARVPGETRPGDECIVGGFPIYHMGQTTVKEQPGWDEIKENNMLILSNNLKTYETKKEEQ